MSSWQEFLGFWGDSREIVDAAASNGQSLTEYVHEIYLGIYPDGGSADFDAAVIADEIAAEAAERAEAEGEPNAFDRWSKASITMDKSYADSTYNTTPGVDPGPYIANEARQCDRLLKQRGGRNAWRISPNRVRKSDGAQLTDTTVMFADGSQGTWIPTGFTPEQAVIQYGADNEIKAPQIITLYRCTCTSGIYAGEQGTTISLYPWGEDELMIKGYDDGGQEYILPEGYHIAESNSGRLEIYHTETGDHCELRLHNGTPAIWHAGMAYSQFKLLRKAGNAKAA